MDQLLSMAQKVRPKYYNPQVSTDIHRYLQIFTDIYRYLQIFTDIYRYLQIFTDIYRYLQIFTVSFGDTKHYQTSNLAMDPMDCPWITAVAVVAVAAFSAAHLSHLTRPADLRPALEALGVTRHDETRVDKSQRYERELNRTRAKMLNKVKKIHIHVSRWSFHMFSCIRLRYVDSILIFLM